MEPVESRETTETGSSQCKAKEGNEKEVLQ